MPIINKKNPQNKKQVLVIEEINKRKIVEHNDLISSVAKMDKTPLKIFELAVSCIDTENPPKDNIIYLSKKELFAFFEVSDTNKHTRFKKAIEKMQKQAYFQIKEIKNKGYEMLSIVPIPTVKWNSYNDEVMIRFNPDIMPYLIDLKQNFTQYALSDVMELGSKYSIVLYKWLCMSYNQYEHYNGKGGRRQQQLEEYKNPSIRVQELREMTDTTQKYKNFNDFEKRVLAEPIEEINIHTHFTVSYEKIKKGTRNDTIQFYIEKKQIAPDSFYKVDDSVYEAQQAEKEQKQTALVIQALQSQYTTILMENMLIGYKDMQDIELMAGLQEMVYPLYDELKTLRGLDGVRDHLAYVSRKQTSYSKTNIVMYLKMAIAQYLVTVKNHQFKS